MPPLPAGSEPAMIRITSLEPDPVTGIVRTALGRPCAGSCGGLLRDPAVYSERVSLCPACTACPGLVMEGDTTRIGEDTNVVVLKKAEWNVLVDAIKSGRLDRV